MDDNRKELAKYRLEKAEKCLKNAQLCITNDDYESAANRSYYAMFHSVRALLAMDGIDFKKHSGVISYFRREYIKEGVLDNKYSDYIGDAFDIRGKSDYDDFYVLSKQDVETQIANAEEMYKTVKDYLADKYSL